MNDLDETTFVEIERPPKSSAIIDNGWDVPVDSDPTPLYRLSKENSVATTYFLALQQAQIRTRPHQSSEIDTRADRIVLELIYASLIELARAQLQFLRRNTASEIAIYVIDQVIEKGFHYEDIEPTFTETEYYRLKTRCIRQTITRVWQKIRNNPELVHIAQIQDALSRGDISLSEIPTTKEKFDSVAKEAHVKLARYIIHLIHANQASRQLTVLLKTAIELFEIDPESIDMSASEYRSLLELYKLAS